MKIKSLLIIIIVIFGLFSCNNSKHEEWVCISGPHYGYQLDLKEKIICEGDTSAYISLITIYADDDNLEDALSYSLIMANKYDYSEAYYDVFDILTSIPQVNANICAEGNCIYFGFDCLDGQTKEIALYYFKQAIYKGSNYASKDLLELYDRNKEFPIKELYSDENLIYVAKKNIR